MGKHKTKRDTYFKDKDAGKERRAGRRKDAGRQERGAGRGGRAGRDDARSGYSPEPRMNENIIAGRNAVTEALRSGREIEKILVADGSEGSIKRIVALAGERGIHVRFEDRRALDRLTDVVHQGVVAFAAAAKYSTVEEILAEAKERGEDPFIMILDDIEDPHNLGAIMRTAECAGVHGIIVAKDRAAGLSGTVAKASAGAIEYMKVARVTNIARTVDQLKDEGLWIAACDMGGSEYTKADLAGPIALVIGNEGKGISRLVGEKCDFTISIPMVGRISSLNASNAASILMYEVVRQRGKKAAE